MCLEPSPQRKAFDELIIGKIGEERKKLPGRMMVSSRFLPAYLFHVLTMQHAAMATSLLEFEKEQFVALKI
jgi:hypothetical protein